MKDAAYSRKLAGRIERPFAVGYFPREAAEARALRLVIGEAGSIDAINRIVLYWLVDETDGVIADAKFQVYGPTSLIGAAESACEILLRKNYDQSKRLSGELIDKHMRDRPDVPAFPESASKYLNLVLEAIDHAVEQCIDIPLAPSYVAPPMTDLPPGQSTEYPGWLELTSAQQMHLLEALIATDVRPYIELDAGGVRVLSVTEGKEVLIAYEGSCTSCYSATGATLSAIQQVLRSRIHPNLVVIPDMSFLHQ